MNIAEWLGNEKPPAGETGSRCGGLGYSVDGRLHAADRFHDAVRGFPHPLLGE